MFWLGAALAVAPVEFSVQRGVYDSPVTVVLSHPDPDATIYYTLDGTEPDYLTGVTPSGSLTFSHTALLRALACTPDECSASVTHTYLFLADVLQQEAPPGLPTMWGDAPADYGMDPEIVGDPTWGPAVEPSLRAFPTMSIVMDPADLWDLDIGIYIHTTFRADFWKRPCSVEFFDPNTGEQLQVNAGTKISGGASRTQTRSPKHSLRLMFKSEYGPPNLDYDLFGPGAVDEFDTLHLRAGYNSTWHHWEDLHRERAQYARDEFARRLQRAMGWPSAHGRYVHLYLNGLYWGLHNLHERPDAGFLSRYLGGNKDQWDALNSGEPTDGDAAAWQELLARSAEDQSDPASYAHTLELLELDNFIDYFILNHWLGNTDWDEKNWYAGRKRVPGAKFMFFAWDSESTLKSLLAEDVTGIHYPERPSGIHRALMANPEYRMRFADRVHLHLGLGVLQADVAAALYDTVAAEVEPGIVAESARWGDYRRDVLQHAGQDPFHLYTKGFWDDERGRLMNVYFPQRTESVYGHYRNAGLYPSTEPPSVGLAAGRHPPGTAIDIQGEPGAAIYYTLDGTDPRLPGGAVAPGASVYTGSLSLSGASRLRARARSASGEWSALTPVDYTVWQPFHELVLNELHYNPDRGAEFLELYHTGTQPLELFGLRIDDGVRYAWGYDAVVGPGEYWVLAADPEEFEATYGFAPDGAYAGRLDNAGERLAIVDEAGALWTELVWSDDAPWPEDADGDGPSLERTSPLGPVDDPANWHASSVPGGTPGAANSVPVVIDTADTAVPDPDADADTDADVDSDTDTDADTDSDADAEPDPEDPGGCGCRSIPASGGALLVGLALVVGRRR